MILKVDVSTRWFIHLLYALGTIYKYFGTSFQERDGSPHKPKAAECF